MLGTYACTGDAHGHLYIEVCLCLDLISWHFHRCMLPSMSNHETTGVSFPIEDNPKI